jgi:hypothetical protein
MSTIDPKTLRALWGEWRKVSQDLVQEDTLTEDELRHQWTNSHLPGLKSSSWKLLSERQAKQLLRAMREATGSGPAYRAALIERIATALWGANTWASELQTRVWGKHEISDLLDLTQAQAHALMEELLSRLARKDVVMAGDEPGPEILAHKIEELRKQFSHR